MIFTSDEWDALQGEVPNWIWYQMRQELLEPILAEALESAPADKTAELEVNGEYGIEMFPFRSVRDVFRDPTAVIRIGDLDPITVQYAQLIPQVEPEPVRRWIVSSDRWESETVDGQHNE